MSVELVIKNPYASSSYSCRVPLSNTVRDVKKLLETSYPTKPKAEDQRLVFFGKIHSDDTSLDLVLKGQDIKTPQVCHLIVSGQSVAQGIIMPGQLSSVPSLSSPPSHFNNISTAFDLNNEFNEDHGDTEPVVPNPLVDVLPSIDPSLEESMFASAMGRQNTFDDEVVSLMRVYEEMLANCIGTGIGVSPEERELSQACEQLIQSIKQSRQIQATSNALLHFPQPLSNTHQQTSNPEFLPPNSHNPPQLNVPNTPHNNHNNNDNNIPLNNAGNHVQGNENVQRGHVRQRVFVINLRLIFRLAFVVYLLGSDSSYSTMLWVFGAAVFYYLHETGIVARLVEGESRVGSRIMRYARIPPNLPEFNSVAIDVKVLAKAFVLSILPSWHVQPYVATNAEPNAEPVAAPNAEVN